MRITKTLYVTNRADWRAWLEQRHQSETEIWLIYYKKLSGRDRIPYADAVEEALCFGWIDSVIQRIDEHRYAQKFTLRINNNKWSALNITRMRKLIADGRMTPAGLSKIDTAVLEREPVHTRPRTVLPAFMKAAFMANPTAWANFRKLAPSYRRQYIGWITAAKRADTRTKRLNEAIALLERNEKLGMR